MENASLKERGKRGSPILLFIIVIAIAVTVMALPLVFLRPNMPPAPEQYIAVTDYRIHFDDKTHTLKVTLQIKNISDRLVNITRITIDEYELTNITFIPSNTIRAGSITSVSGIVQNLDPVSWGPGTEHILEIRYIAKGEDFPRTYTLRVRVIS